MEYKYNELTLDARRKAKSLFLEIHLPAVESELYQYLESTGFDLDNYEIKGNLFGQWLDSASAVVTGFRVQSFDTPEQGERLEDLISDFVFEETLMQKLLARSNRTIRNTYFDESGELV